MNKLTYLYNPKWYTAECHVCWNYLLHNLKGIEITATSRDGFAIEFIPHNENAAFLTKFLSDCDFGVVLDETHRKEYEQENGPLF